MNLEFLQDWSAAGFGFELSVLLAVAGAYVLFELLLLARARIGQLDPSDGPSGQALGEGQRPTDLTRGVLEAYRPVSSWASLLD